MRSVFRHFKGDKVLWGVVALLAIFSFLPVFSASSNLSYVVGVGTPTGYLIKHFIILIFGFFLIIWSAKKSFRVEFAAIIALIKFSGTLS